MDCYETTPLKGATMNEPQPDISISNLKERPVFLETVANRMWREWWKSKDKTEQDVVNGVKAVLDKGPFYNGYVAIKNGAYAGSALVIPSDMKERPDLSPWIGAVFVEPEQRNQGVGTAILAHAVQQTFKQGLENIYLCATQKNALYYEKRGWEKIEETVGPDRLTILRIGKEYQTPESI